jgi:hypothetical protein
MNMNKDQIALENAYKEIVNEGFKEDVLPQLASLALTIGLMFGGGKAIVKDMKEKMRESDLGLPNTPIPNIDDPKYQKKLSEYLNILSFYTGKLDQKHLDNLELIKNNLELLSPEQKRDFDAAIRHQERVRYQRR